MSEFFVVGGTLRPDAACYIERPADEQLYQLCLRGEFAYVLSTRQMGKSSLMIRTAQRLRETPEAAAATVDLTQLGVAETGERGEQWWYFGIAERIAEQLDLSADLETWWDDKKRLPPVRGEGRARL